MADFHKIWIDQCEATEGLRERFGVEDAIRCLAGEKLMNMKTKQPKLVAGLLMLVCAMTQSCSLSSPALVRGNPTSATYIITNVAIFDGETFHTDMFVLIKDKKIHQIGRSDDAKRLTEIDNVERIDGKNKTLIPGLIDMHAHLMAGSSAPWNIYRPNLQTRIESFLYAGVTTVFLTSAKVKEMEIGRERVAAGKPSPRLIPAFGPLTAEGGHPIPYLKTLLPWPVDWFLTKDIATASSVEEAIEWVHQMKEELDPLFVKIVYDDVPYGSAHLSHATLKAAIAKAAEMGIKVIVHIGNANDAIEAADAGAAALAHTPSKTVLSKEEIDGIKGKGIPIFSTVRMFKAQHDQEKKRVSALELESVPKQFLHDYQSRPEGWRLEFDDFDFEIDKVFEENFVNAKKNVMSLYRAGMQILPGTDTGVPGVFPGSSLHREIILLNKLGIPAKYLLEAATSKAAHFLEKGNHLGRIKVGYEADLVLLRGNPLKDIRAISQIDLVFSRGQKISRFALEQ